jgi:nitrate/nitrite-specific signal transduction histidine kinase
MRAGKNAEAEPEFTSLLEVARDAHADVRESILNLKTGTRAEWSLTPALKQYLSDFQTHHGIHTGLSLPAGLKENTFDPGAEVQLLRVIQKALTNARKHSLARNIQVNLELENYRGTETFLSKLKPVIFLCRPLGVQFKKFVALWYNSVVSCCIDQINSQRILSPIF